MYLLQLQAKAAGERFLAAAEQNDWEEVDGPVYRAECVHMVSQMVYLS